MSQSNDHSTVLLLIILIAVLNGKAIFDYLSWLRFKITTFFKQLENERKNRTNHRSRTLQRERQGSVQRW
jgi:hypothetical protein